MNELATAESLEPVRRFSLRACSSAFCSPRRWRMAEHTTVEEQVIDFIQRARACDLEALSVCAPI